MSEIKHETLKIDTRNLANETREKSMMFMGIPVVALLIPFGIVNLIDQSYVMSATAFIIAFLTGLNSWAIYSKKSAPIHFLTYSSAVILAMLGSFYYVGESAIFWSFPASLMFHFIGPRHQARFISISFVGLAIVTTYLLLPEVDLFRFAVTLFLVNIFGALFVKIIVSLQFKLTELAVKDPLTKAYNRLEYNKTLEEEVERSRRGSGPLSMLVLDIDYFKSINDTYGHATGDHVLREVAAIMLNRLRKLDKCFRVGGEEFVIILAQTNLKGSEHVAEDICKQVREASLIKDRQVTISIGIAELGEHEVIDVWEKRADANLYKAKEAGRNQVAA